MNGSRKLAVTLAALLLGAVGVEIVVRIACRDEWDAPVIAGRQAAGSFGPLVRYCGDPVLYYELRPELDVDFHGSRVVTDAGSCRIREHPRVHDPACAPGAPPLRVAVVGPSTTFGFKVSAEQSYPDRLVAGMERLWKRPVELRNVSVPGYNAEQEARVFELHVLPWRPDLVLWHYDHRDAFPVIGPGSRIELPPYFGDNLLHSAAWKLLARKRRAAELETLRFADGSATGQFEGYVVSGPLWDRHLAALQRVTDAARARGIPLVLVLFDAFVRGGEAGRRHVEALHAPLVPRLEAMGFGVIDMFPRCAAEMERRGWKDLRAFWLSIEPLDGHPNADGHAFLAESVSAWLAGQAAMLPAAGAADDADAAGTAGEPATTPADR